MRRYPPNWTAGGWPTEIGVGYVDTEEGRHALRGADALARRTGATLRVLTVVHANLSMVAATPSLAVALNESTGEEVRKGLEDLETRQRLQAESELQSGSRRSTAMSRWRRRARR